MLSDQTIYETLAEQKPNQQEQYKFKREEIRKYFPKSYTDKQIYDTVFKLLEQWQRKRNGTEIVDKKKGAEIASYLCSSHT